ncbi:hypothetical protein L3V82_12535 [Thiotrichales bacterium 19S3-7]|nr:hypothetical protein [Thiotrichales bacterium 19S3-7]MCF6803018.1 hypothetical protein [Thiotrichales bacterium 19S3-11]
MEFDNIELTQNITIDNGIDILSDEFDDYNDDYLIINDIVNDFNSNDQW